MGGRRVEVKRPRVRSVDGRELPLPTWEHLAGAEALPHSRGDISISRSEIPPPDGRASGR